MEKLTLFISFFTTLFFLSACGITEELDQAKTTLTTIQESITTQKQFYKDINRDLTNISSDFTADLKMAKGQKLDPDGDYKVFENITSRKNTLTNLNTENEETLKLAKQLDSINKKNGVDVDHEQLKLIINSLAILNSNYESIVSFSNTNFEQENDFYSDLPKDIKPQLSIIKRTYGSIELIAEEAQANIDYSNSLIKSFLTTAAKNPELSHDK